MNVDIVTFSDADLIRTFYYRQIDTLTPVDLTGCSMRMMVRKAADDATVFIELSTGIGSSGLAPNIFITDTINGIFGIEITRQMLLTVAPGVYVHSLIMQNINGIRTDIWRGTLTHSIGPTRYAGT